MTKLVFLGTAGMVPTKERNVQSLYLEHQGDGILLDCGEGTQRQMSLAGLSLQKINTILISHWHGDHIGGLSGLIQTMGNFASPDKSVKLFGPVGSTEHFEHLLASFIGDSKLNIEIIEIAPTELTTFFETAAYALQAILLEHSVPCLGFRFEKKERRSIDTSKLPQGLSGPVVGKLQQGESVEYNGEVILSESVSTLIPAKRIAFIFDTQICEQCTILANDSDVLVSEAVYTHDLAHKAKEYQHLTAQQIAQVAKDTSVKQLILTHFSQRYKDVAVLADDAKKVFSEVLCAKDFMELEFDF